MDQNIKRRNPKLRWSTKGQENIIVPCARCGSVAMTIEAVTDVSDGEPPRFVNIEWRCENGHRGCLGIGQTTDFFENGSKPMLMIYTD